MIYMVLKSCKYLELNFSQANYATQLSELFDDKNLLKPCQLLCKGVSIIMVFCFISFFIFLFLRTSCGILTLKILLLLCGYFGKWDFCLKKFYRGLIFQISAKYFNAKFTHCYLQFILSRLKIFQKETM